MSDEQCAVTLVGQSYYTWTMCFCGMQFAGAGVEAARAEWKAKHHADRCPAAKAREVAEVMLDGLCATVITLDQPPDIGADVPGGGAV